MAVMGVVLVRGINVGGRGRLPMADFRAVLEGLGCTNVSTYLQSGNAVAECVVFPDPDAVADALAQRMDSRPDVLVLPGERLLAAHAGCPWPDATGKQWHLWFLATAPAPDRLARLMELASATEQVHLAGDTLYLLAPDGIGRSKLAAAVERRLGVAGTARNGNTVAALAGMVEGLPQPARK